MNIYLNATLDFFFFLGTFNLLDLSAAQKLPDYSPPNPFTQDDDDDVDYDRVDTSLNSFSNKPPTTNAIDVLRVHNITESHNFTCQAQNAFGLIVYNLSVVVKGK